MRHSVTAYTRNEKEMSTHIQKIIDPDRKSKMISKNHWWLNGVEKNGVFFCSFMKQEEHSRGCLSVDMTMNEGCSFISRVIINE